MRMVKKTVKKIFDIGGYDLYKKDHKIIVEKKKATNINYEKLVDKIFECKELQEKPPVLLDIGASGGMNEAWKYLAKHSIAVGFDADSRELGEVENQQSGYRKLYIHNSIVADKTVENETFYLTRSPYCSSMLPPDSESLKNWNYSDLFEVERTVKINSTALAEVLTNFGIGYIDWIKTDSQGIDLRLIKSIPKDMYDNIISIEFEPGILDSYQGEDKLSTVMHFMETQPFWMTKFNVKGASRVAIDDVKSNLGNEYCKYFTYGKEITNQAPGWAEVEYLKEYENVTNKRDMLILALFSLMQKQEGYALRVANIGYEKFRTEEFLTIKEFILESWKKRV